MGDNPADREVVQAAEEAEIVLAAGEVGSLVAEIQRHGDGRHEHHISGDAVAATATARTCNRWRETCKVSL